MANPKPPVVGIQTPPLNQPPGAFLPSPGTTGGQGATPPNEPTLAAYTFLPWLRRGLVSRAKSTVDPVPLNSDPGPLTGNLSVTWTLTEKRTPEATPTPTTTVVPLPLAGPGEVVGVDRTAILRCWPPPGAQRVEPNYFPLLELRDADLPWRYSPVATPTDLSKNLMPWLCLLCLSEEEFTPLGRVADGGANCIQVKNSKTLPDPSWVADWSHVQLTTATLDGNPAEGASAATPPPTHGKVHPVDDTLKQRLLNGQDKPTELLARLLCPRRLQPRTRYHVFLVPTFMRGVLAGIGGSKELQDLTATPHNTKAWSQRPDASVTLPYYHTWQFSTGEATDFEAMVNALKPLKPPQGLGQRTLTVSLEEYGGQPIQVTVPTAIAPPGNASPNTVPTGRFMEYLGLPSRKRQELRLRDNALRGAETPTMLPPLYAEDAFARGNPSIQTSGLSNTDGWFWEVNSDPGARVVAGLGAELFRKEQEAYMDEAWQQLQSFETTRKSLHRLEFSAEITEVLHRRYVAGRSSDALLQLGRKLMKPDSRSLSPATQLISDAIHGLEGTTLPPSALDPQLKRRMTLGLKRVKTPATTLKSATATSAGPATTPSTTTTGPTNAGPSNLGGSTSFQNTSLLNSLKPSQGLLVSSTALKDIQEIEHFEYQSRILPDLDNVSNTRGIPNITNTISTQLHPDQSLRNPIVERLEKQLGTFRPSAKPLTLAPRLFFPCFDAPLFSKLKELDARWILAGLEDVPADSVLLMQSNQRFIESFLVGINHELSRELLWREFPCNLGGTAFQHFWEGYDDPSDDAAVPLSQDIGPIHLWGNKKLGQKNGQPSEGMLVLVLRSDLFYRYPNTLVYASKANGTANEPQFSLDNPEIPPLIAGRLEPDVAFFGFNLEKEDLTKEAGYFFVFQEQVAELRFGLDVAPSGAEIQALKSGLPYGPNLSWEHIDREVAWLHAHTPVKNKKEDPDPTRAVDWQVAPDSPANAASFAHITLQQPVRVAIHAKTLLPRPESVLK